MGFGYKPDNKEPAAIPEVIGDNPSVKPAEEQVLHNADETLQKKDYVADTFHNRVAVNTRRFVDVVADLKGYADGSPIKVIYYKEHYSETDFHGRHHTEEHLHNVHKSVLKIIDFEIRMTGSLQYNHDQDENISKLEGEAFTYPGFEPEKGDKLIIDIGDGRYGAFEVNKPPVRTSIRASTYFKISFSFVHWATEEWVSHLDEAVVTVAYFDKLRFLNEPGALLEHDEVVEMKFLAKQRAKMIHYYKSKFLDEVTMYSFMRPDNVYDPYVTDFLMKTLEFTELGTMSVQLYQDAPFMDMSLWRALLDPNIPLEGVPTAASRTLYRLGSKSVLMNSLLNRYYVRLVKSKSLKDYLDELMASLNGNGEGEGDGSSDGPEGDPSIPEMDMCPCCDGIIGDLLLHIHPHYCECPWVNGETDESSGTTDSLGYILGEGDHFKLIYMFLMYRRIDLKLLHKLIEGVWKLSPIEQFYRMPIYVYLCKLGCDYIHHENGIFEP